MSSDEGEPGSPVLQGDSDRGSSVSSELQEEYEQLLRYAVVTPKYEPSIPSQLLSISQLSKTAQSSTLMEEKRPPSSAVSADNGSQSGSRVSSARATPLPEESRTQSSRSHDEESAAISVASDGESERPPTGSGRSGHSSPDPHITNVKEMFISKENLNKMENILDTWSNSLKVNVMAELQKWKLAFVERHRVELEKERERHASHLAGLNSEMESLKDLLRTYEISNQRKDEVIVNLSRAVDRQREKLELMRTFTQWRLQYGAAREEHQGAKLAKQHYQLQLKRKVWAAWRSLIQSDWRARVERACQARAQEVCVQLSSDYEGKMAEHEEALHKAHADIERLREERERYEDSMKKAFMRGVCALNIEALTMFNTGEARQERDAPPPREAVSSSSLAGLHPHPAASARLSPVFVESPVLPAPSRSDVEDTNAGRHPQFPSQFGCSSAGSRAEAWPSTTVVKTAPVGGGFSSLRQSQSSTRIVTAGQQKASRTVTARLTGRSELTKTVRPLGSLHVMGVVPPMSSVIVERHHPVTQLTVGQATAARFPRSALRSQGLSGSKGTSGNGRGQPAFQIHSIKVVD